MANYCLEQLNQLCVFVLFGHCPTAILFLSISICFNCFSLPTLPVPCSVQRYVHTSVYSLRSLMYDFIRLYIMHTEDDPCHICRELTTFRGLEMPFSEGISHEINVSNISQ